MPGTPTSTDEPFTTNYDNPNCYKKGCSEPSIHQKHSRIEAVLISESKSDIRILKMLKVFIVAHKVEFNWLLCE